MTVLIRTMIFACNSFSCNDRFVIEWKNSSKISVKNINSTCNPCFIECMYFKNDTRLHIEWRTMEFMNLESILASNVYNTFDVMHIFMVYCVTNTNFVKTFVFSWRWSCSRWQHRSALLVRVPKGGLACARFGHKYKETNVCKNCGLQNSCEDSWNKYTIYNKLWNLNTNDSWTTETHKVTRTGSPGWFLMWLCDY